MIPLIHLWRCGVVILILTLPIDGGLPAAASMAALRSNLLSEIQVQRRGCHGVCPEYTVTLRRTGVSTLDVKFGTERSGLYEAVMFEQDFERLAQLVDDLDFSSLPDSYHSSKESPGPYGALVTTRGDRVKTVTFDVGEMPVRLWGLTLAIDGLSETRIPWQPSTQRR